MQDPDYFIHSQGFEYEPSNRIGYTSVEVLPHLKGHKWDEIALAYVHSLRPSYIRVIKAEETTDAHLWRVTVYIDEDHIIEKITQEVAVALPGGIHNGYELNMTFILSLNSKYKK